MVAAPVLEIIEQAESVDRAAAPAFAVYLRETFKMPKVWHQGAKQVAKPAQESAKHSEDMKIFDFEGHNVRTVTINNEPWFVLGDVCKVLELASHHVSARLNSEDKNTIVINDGKRGNPNKVCVNESGLYDVILDSRKPQAKQFRRWITSEVIPSIRKHGGYLTPEKVEETLLSPDTIIQLAQNLKAEQEVMEIKQVPTLKKRLDQADLDSIYISSNGQKRKVLAVNESGLYDVILDSRKQLRASEHEIPTL